MGRRPGHWVSLVAILFVVLSLSGCMGGDFTRTVVVFNRSAHSYVVRVTDPDGGVASSFAGPGSFGLAGARQDVPGRGEISLIDPSTCATVGTGPEDGSGYTYVTISEGGQVVISGTEPQLPTRELFHFDDAHVCN